LVQEGLVEQVVATIAAQTEVILRLLLFSFQLAEAAAEGLLRLMVVTQTSEATVAQVEVEELVIVGRNEREVLPLLVKETTVAVAVELAPKVQVQEVAARLLLEAMTPQDFPQPQELVVRAQQTQ